MIPVVALLALAVLAAPAAWAQSVDPGRAPREARAARTGSAPGGEGTVDAPAWASPPAISGFVQHEPFEGRPVTERTEVRILYDQDAVYLGAWLYDADPSGIG